MSDQLKKLYKPRKTEKIMLLAFLLCFSIFSITSCYAENIGVYGQVYTIAEPDLLMFIHQRLIQFRNDGRLQSMEKGFEKRVAKHIVRPASVSGVSDASLSSKVRTFYYKPTFILQKNIYDASGKLLFTAGMRVNPLNQKEVSAISPGSVIPQFNETLFFINADKKSQIDWVKSQVGGIDQMNHVYKIILVKGNLKKASNELGRIYFDQDGVLCHQFGINRVPAVLTRSGTRLKIEESPV